MSQKYNRGAYCIPAELREIELLDGGSVDFPTRLGRGRQRLATGRVGDTDSSEASACPRLDRGASNQCELPLRSHWPAPVGRYQT